MDFKLIINIVRLLNSMFFSSLKYLHTLNDVWPVFKFQMIHDFLTS